MLSLCHLLPKGSGSSTKVIAAGAAGLCRGQGQGSCSSGSCRCCRAEDPASAAATLAALLLTGGADPFIEQCLCLPYAGMGTVSNKSLQQSACSNQLGASWRFITACLDVFTQTEAVTFFQHSWQESLCTLLISVWRRKVLTQKGKLQDKNLTSDCRRREAVAGGGEQMEVEGSNQQWREAMRCGGEQSEVGRRS